MAVDLKIKQLLQFHAIKAYQQYLREERHQEIGYGDAAWSWLDNGYNIKFNQQLEKEGHRFDGEFHYVCELADQYNELTIRECPLPVQVVDTMLGKNFFGKRQAD